MADSILLRSKFSLKWPIDSENPNKNCQEAFVEVIDTLLLKFMWICRQRENSQSNFKRRKINIEDLCYLIPRLSTRLQ